MLGIVSDASGKDQTNPKPVTLFSNAQTFVVFRVTTHKNRYALFALVTAPIR
jgi:hypothetical protein